MTVKTMAVGSTAVALTLALAASASASASVEIREDLRPGQLVRDHGVGVVVPERGEFTIAHAHTIDGSQTVRVHTRQDGTVVVSEAGSEAVPAFKPGGPLVAGESSDDEMRIYEPPQAIPACDDGAYRRNASFPWSNGKFIKWKSTFKWWFRASTTPDYMYVDNTRDALRRAVANIVGAHNECEMPDTVDATQDFQGDTSVTPDISADGIYCLGSDHDDRSVVAFGYLYGGGGALTCVFGEDDGGTYARITSADVRLDKYHDYWYAIKPANCYERYSVEAVMTHEFGHVFGLHHVEPEEQHGWLTMSPRINGPCQNSEATLGRGDVWGLQAIY